ncbi:MAG TPA: selenium-binding family protein [Candidatus Limnocylindrales bacterium]|nr:selenium-binding family protein [Candidatus Limnocylindrales bacterium]
MATLRPDPTFYPSARAAMTAPAEELAYVALLNTASQPAPDAIGVVDLDPASTTYGTVVGRVEMPSPGDELHHFGWNMCSSALCPYAPHPHTERRYLIVPGLRSSRLTIVDTKPDPRAPTISKVIEPADVIARSGYSRPHTVHCGPEGVYVSAIGNPDGDAPGGIFLMDHDTFEIKGPWERDRGPQQLAYDFWWHLGHDTMVTSEWATPNMVEAGLDPSLFGQFGHRLHVWDLRRRSHLQTLDLGEEQQMVLEVRPSHDPNKALGFVGVVVSLKDLSGSIWTWYRENGEWAVRKIIEIPAEPAAEEDLPPALKPFKAVPPLVVDIELSLDDRFLYVTCWGTGELRQYDVSDPFAPRLTSTIRLGGITAHAAHPAAGVVNGAPQMIELSRDGRRLYLTNSLYAAWDRQFYPEGIKGWMVKVDVDTEAGGMRLDPDFFIPFEGERPHQVRLQGGDASSDSYCFA